MFSPPHAMHSSEDVLTPTPHTPHMVGRPPLAMQTLWTLAHFRPQRSFFPINGHGHVFVALMIMFYYTMVYPPLIETDTYTVRDRELPQFVVYAKPVWPAWAFALKSRVRQTLSTYIENCPNLLCASNPVGLLS